MSYRWHPGFAFALFAWSNAASADDLPAAGAAGLGAAAVATGAVLLSGSKPGSTVDSSTSSQLAGTNASPASDASGGDGNRGGITSRGAAAGADSASAGGMLSPGRAAGTYYVNGAGTVSDGNFGATLTDGGFTGLETLIISGTAIFVYGTISSTITTH